ncbi:nuclear transport factor 2 family protein [Gilliamella sp. B3172]|uniref:nuclear transport factor 2 family protein n=1 Tax=Gilliamella sp. B3172 TaxID=2818006 RepID=UPI002269A950|nr:nuclear transport factor 2 family protein [Gilliamella sp. B3172]MCX8640630.1 nuclear transport factor 2 family protein [Gilliamella sp. B3172]
MKKILTMVLLLVLSVSQSFAATPNQTTIEQTVESLRLAMLNADKAQLEQLASTNLSYGHSNAMVENKAEFVDAIVSGRSGFTTLAFQDQSIITDGDTAIVRHTFVADTNNSGTIGKVKIGVMLVFKNADGEWKLLARQAYKLPQ